MQLWFKRAHVKGIPVVVCAFEFAFMGGSMASVVGARFVEAIKVCMEEDRALNLFYSKWRCSYARSVIFTNANGENQCCISETISKKIAVYFCFDRPYNGRRICESWLC